MDFMFDWEGENDRFSFEDSDRFEEDSLCSWISEPESLCNNWRGWRKQNGNGPSGAPFGLPKEEGQVTSLVELAAQAVACHIPFEVVEHFYPPIPENLQLRIAYWSFPENEEDIRLYSCLANGSADEFQKGDHLFKGKAVKEALQIGFHLSATIIPPQTLAQGKGVVNVAIVFDRRRITSCTCTCSSTASWCAHVVALCLYRIHQPNSVCLRAPVSESLNRLHRDQLQKFAQYLISELPQQILPTAQRLLDELLSSQQTAINTVCGAPDPTAGPSASEQTTWCLDEGTLHENIKKTLIKFCVPSPIVFSDVNYLSSTAPPVAAEWQSLLRPLRGREPEGMWNLLSIVREMYKRNDSNAIPLLHILTEEVLNCEQILIWWFNTKISASHNNSTGHGARNGQNSNSSSQHAASSLCDEIVTLWRLAALNPALSPIERDDLDTQVRDWHILTIDKVRKGRGNNIGGTNNTVRKTDIEIFSGFKAAIEACKLDWSDYVIPGVTYEDSYRAYWKFSHAVVSNKLSDADSKKTSRGKSGVAGVITSQVLHPSYQSDHGILIPGLHRSQDFHPVSQTDGAYSSSSEGFCESDRRDSVLRQNDSDSDLGDIDGIQSAAGIQNAAKHYSEMLSSAGCERVQAKSVPGTSSASGSRGSKDVNKDRMAGMMGVLEHSSAVAAVVSGAGNANEGNVENANDEYQVYFYNGSVAKPRPEQNQEKKKKSEEPNYFAGIKPVDNKLEVLFARAEALHAHGHTHEACKLAKQLAEDMLTNPPDLSLEQPHPTGKGKKKKVQNSISSYASSTLAKAAFLCSVLLEEPECHHLAFRVGLFGLEMPRPPASSKALEVKLAYQESEMVTLLKKIPLGSSELAIIRERAEKLRDGKLKTRGEALLPLTLASFIFDSLCLPSCTVTGGLSSRVSGHSVHSSYGGPAADEKLGFEAATAALGLKANVSEADHPLLCEGTRRQRGDLAVTMLVHYKEDQEKLSKIMDKLLDKEVHQLFKAPSLSTYLSASSTSSRNTTLSPQIATPAVSQSVDAQGGTGSTHRKSPSSGCESDDSMSVRVDTPQSCSGTLVASSSCGDIQASAMVNMSNAPTSWPAGGIQAEAQDPRLEYLNLEQNFTDLSLHGHKADGNNQTGSPAGARPKTTKLYHYNSKDTDSSAVEEDTETSADYKAWAARFRCTNLKTIKKHSTGMASIDSSAPETTSSDNSPTLVRRNWTKHQGPGSDSGSSGKSSDSFGSSNSGDKLAAAKTRDNESDSCCVDSPPVPYEVRCTPQMIPYSRSSTPNIKGMRYKGKNRIMPTIPNQPSEASAHFMFELAKTVLAKAGGNSSTSLFTQPANNNNPSGPHRALHLCAFQIGLYALGLYNCVSPNWLSRTYSSHVSWITGQAMEIGSAAINILIYTWEGHLTPQEVASLADRASRGRDPNMVRAAAELALSCLPHAQALNPNEIQRALIQCKEQSQEMLERACLAVESAAKGGGVYPEVLFDVARRWYELYEESIPGSSQPNQAGLAAVESEEAQIIVVAQNGVQAVAASGENTSPPMIQLVPAQSISTTGAAQGIPLQAAAVAGQAQLQPGIPVHAIPYTIPPPHNPHSQLPHHPYIAPYSYVQQIPPNFAHHYSAPHIPLHTHNIHPSYMATYPYQSQSAAFANLPHLHNTATLYHANMSHLRPPPPTTLQIAFPATTAQLQVLHNQRRLQGSLQMAPVDQASGQSALNSQQNQNQQNNVQQVQQVAPEMNIPGQNTPQFNYLLAAYRVGMLAMETQARRVHDDRPQSKYSRNPPYGEDVKWLLSMAMKLGVNYLQQFCASAVSAIVSPFVLHDIAIEAAHYLARSNPAQMTQQLRNPTLNSLMQKCLQMFIQCTHHKIHHINQTDYDDFVSIICSARNAFCMTPGGMVQFNEMLQSLRRSKSCKKELWQRIINGLSTGNV